MTNFAYTLIIAMFVIPSIDVIITVIGMFVIKHTAKLYQQVNQVLNSYNLDRQLRTTKHIIESV